MASRLFLARTEEQNKFRQVLQSFQTSLVTQHFPTFSKPFTQPKREINSPHIFLLHGEGGMGKSSLSRRLREIAETDFGTAFNRVWLDWEEERDNYIELQVGADQIKPETVLGVLQKNFECLGRNFKDYLKAKKRLEEIEDKIDRELRSQVGAEKYRPLIGGGLGLAVSGLRKLPFADQVIASDEAAKNITDAATLALVGLLQEKLSLADRKLFASPTMQLAEALGKGLRDLTVGKPAVIFLDTYEIVDRPECDYGLRQVMKSAGNNVVWIVAGRANLTKSRGLTGRWFRGYEQDFSENLYSFSLAEFNGALVAEYFKNDVLDRPLPQDGADRIAQFSLGIPFVVNQIAEIWKGARDVSLDEILAGSSDEGWDESSHDKVVRVTSERFLKHCFAKNAPEDLRMICAIALLRQPDNDLLKAMLQSDDFVGAVDGLKQRHSFILLEGKGIRLHDKLEDFLREALRSDSILLNLKIQEEMLRELNEYAVMFLQEKLEKLTKDLPISERFEDDRIANGMLSLVHHLFWLDEERGWEYAVPRFVEGWQYNRNWIESLLEVITAFQENLYKLGQKRLKIFLQGSEITFYEFAYDFFYPAIQDILDELQKINCQKTWLKGDGEQERRSILLLESGQVKKAQKKYSEALNFYIEAEKYLPQNAASLQESLGKALENVGDQFCEQEKPDWASAILAYDHSVRLQPNNDGSWFGMGIALNELGRNEEAITSYDKALKINPDDHYVWNNRGLALDELGRNEEAIASYDKALEINPDKDEAWYNRGIPLRQLGRYEEAIASYDKALEINPDFHEAWDNKGYAFFKQGKFQEAIDVVNQSIKINPQYANAIYNKGGYYLLQGDFDTGLKLLKESFEIDSSYQEMAKTDGDFDPIRDDPRFQALIQGEK